MSTHITHPQFHLDVFSDILKLNIGVSQPDNQRMFEWLNNILPLTIYRYPSGTEHNGWIVPDEWEVKQALILHNGKIMFDGTIHPLAVAGYSPSFVGFLSKTELDAHIFTRPTMPNAYPFHCMNNYRPWAREWGFCIPYNVWRQWPDGEYEVQLYTEYKPGEMLVAEYHHQGELEETIVFNAHTCHPCQFNDDLSGVAVILSLFKQIQQNKTRYSYRALFAPEHLGTVFYLSDRNPDDQARLKAGIFVEMVGIDRPLALQHSFTGNHIIDYLAENLIRSICSDAKIGDFRTIVGNDETVWEAPGIEIPFISISRCVDPGYYPQYHTSDDNLMINSEMKLAEAKQVLEEIVNIFEVDSTITRHFNGLVALSNPKYDLYVQRPDPTVDKQFSEQQMQLGSIQDRLPRYFNGKKTVFELARQFNLPFNLLYAYLCQFEKKDLISMHRVKGMDHYQSS